MFWEVSKYCPGPVVSLRNSSGKCCPFEHGGSASYCCLQMETAPPAFVTFVFCRSAGRAEGCKREHWPGRSGIQGPETRCSVSFLVIFNATGAWGYRFWFRENLIIFVMRRAKLGIHIEICSVKGWSTPASYNIQGVVLFLLNHSKHRHLCGKSQEESLKISWTHRPCHALTPPYQSWGVLTGGCQEASTVTVHDVPVLQRGIKVEKMNFFMCSQPNKKVYLYKALVISQSKNWVQMLMRVELVSIQVMFCPSFP